MDQMYKENIHIFRGISILAIVATHTIGTMSWNNSPVLERILFSLSHDCSVWFIIISGYLFQYLINRRAYFDFLVNKMKRIITPYIVVSIPAIIWILKTSYMHSILPEILNLPPVTEVIVLYTTGMQLGPYWFMPMMFIFFITAPAFIYMDNKQWLYVIAVPLGFVTLLTNRNFLYINWNYSWWTDPISNYIHYIFVFIIGMLLSRYEQEFQKKMQHFIKFAIPLCMILLIYLVATPKFSDAANTLYKILSAISLIYLLSKINIRRRLKKMLSYTGNMSFGIYFIHVYVIGTERYTWKKFISGTLPEGGIALYFLNFLIITIVSICIVMICKFIAKNKSRYIVGY